MSKKAVGTKDEVFDGQADHTKGGLKKGDLKLNKQGKVVSKARSALAKKNLGGFTKALAATKKELGIRKGDDFESHIPRKGTALYKKTMKRYDGSLK